jgi:hypothetical protein
VWVEFAVCQGGRRAIPATGLGVPLRPAAAYSRGRPFFSCQISAAIYGRKLRFPDLSA